MKILETKKLTHQKWLNLYESIYENNGKQSKWIFASRNRDANNNFLSVANAIVIVPVLVLSTERRLVLIKEYRVAIQNYEYHFPAGLLEPGESVENCARRELKEEAGFDLLKIRQISPLMPSSSGLTDETSIMVFADCTLGDSKQNLDDNENIEVIPLSHTEICEWLKKPLLYAAKTWPIMLLYAQLNSLEITC